VQHESLTLFLDASNSESGQLALSACAIVGSIVASVVSGYLLSVIKSSRAQTRESIIQLGLQIATECDARRAAIDSEVKERQQAINNEGDIRRTKDEELGRDISRIRERLAYDRGQAEKPFPGED
jgi:ADP-glucose pyrophosphorylase